MTDTDQPAISAAVVVRDGRVLMIRRRVAEGDLSWQFPAGAIEDETPEQAAVRETAEETGLTVEAVKLLGERVHPKTGRQMYYVACATGPEGDAYVADVDEIAEVAWVAHGEIANYVPYALFEPVQEYLDDALAS